jgi:arabinofuranosyltransferase
MPTATDTTRAPARLRRQRALVLALLAVAVLLGGDALAFLCDDSFIHFRYASNLRDGHGLVWNPPPWRPVDGYSSFLWSVSVWAGWTLTGVEPPRSANWVSMAQGLGLFAVVAAAAFRIRDRRGARLPDFAVFCTLAAVAGNRTFLQWLTGGLGTSLFNLTMVGWVLHAFRGQPRRGVGWLAGWAGWAAAAGLARPDGLLFVGGTVAVAGLGVLRGSLRASAALGALAPLLAVAAHLGWHLWYYGELLPNTYYAKVSAPWPEAGIRYFLSFAFEHGVWLWLPLAVTWLAVEVARARGRLVGLLLVEAPAVAAVAAVLVHLGYYTLRVGGDPFEYRVLSQLVPLGALSAAAMAARLGAGGGRPAACTLALGLAASVGWVHLWLTEPKQTLCYVPLAAKLPGCLQPIWRWHDRLQAWLHVQVLCGRPHQHAAFLDGQRAMFPPRARATVDPEDRPVVALRGVGYSGWVLPDFAILDELGLNDWVAARSPAADLGHRVLPREALAAVLATADGDHDGRYTRSELTAGFGALPGAQPHDVASVVDTLLLLFADERDDSLTPAEAARIEPFFADLRFMAHSRLAPQAYLAAFEPNVTIEGGRAVVHPRAAPLTADRVRRIEAEWRDRVRAAGVR